MLYILKDAADEGDEHEQLGFNPTYTTCRSGLLGKLLRLLLHYFSYL